MERLEFDLLFRWFVGLGIDDAVWDHSVFSKKLQDQAVEYISEAKRRDQLPRASMSSA